MDELTIGHAQEPKKHVSARVAGDLHEKVSHPGNLQEIAVINPFGKPTFGERGGGHTKSSFSGGKNIY